MRLGTAGAVLFVACCVVKPAAPAGAAERACSVKECFLANDVRKFDVIDRTTLIVYTGSQRCAFRVELRGTFCDMTYAPELVFSDPTELPQGETSRRIAGGPTAAQNLGFPDDPNLPTRRHGRASLKVCDNDLKLQVSGGAFTDEPFSTTDPASDISRRDPRFLNPRVACEVASVKSLTDDQVMEIYVAHGLVAPPPPMGPGQIEVGKQGGAQAPPPSNQTNGGNEQNDNEQK
jgi:hypothetical protein